MFKVILKTALKTLFVVIILALFAFAIASLGFPSEMAGLCEKSGNYSMAAGYANLSYSYTKSADDKNRCFIDSAHARNDSDIVKYGDELIAHENFPEVCAKNDETYVTESGKEIKLVYKQYVYGNLAAAKYRKGDKEGALETAKTAMNGVEGFPDNNALAILSLQVLESADKDTAGKLLNEIVTNHQDTENEYYNVLINELTKVGGQE